MIYPYKCKCGAYDEVYRPARDASLPQTCTCGATMERVYTVPYVAVEKVEGYDPGLGRYIKNKNHKRDVIKQINYATGQDLIEIGNEKPKVAPPKKQEYDIPAESIERIIK
jgi:hypothetical protein